MTYGEHFVEPEEGPTMTTTTDPTRWARRRRIRFYLASGQTVAFRAVDVSIDRDPETGACMAWSAVGVRGRVPFSILPSAIVGVSFGRRLPFPW